MIRRTVLFLSLASALPWLGSCANTSNQDIRRQYDPELEDLEIARRDAIKRQEDFNLTLLQLDTSIDSYVLHLSRKGIASQDTKVQQLDRLIRQKVNGGFPAGSNSERLIAAASDSEQPRSQGIALAALGFSNAENVMPIILQGAQLDDPFLVDRAVLGLAILKDPRTPPGIIAAIAEDPDYHEYGRVQAAWALYVLQESSLHTDEILPVWVRILKTDDNQHPAIISTAIRGLGYARDATNAQLVIPYLSHPVARVRFNATIALGRMNAQEAYAALIERLEPAETVQNVRLGARKALQALAGGVDRGYDAEQWRMEFERKSAKELQETSQTGQPEPDR